MSTHDELTPELARLVARLWTFLNEAEHAMATAQPDQVVQVAGHWTQLCRELRRVPEAHWPSAAFRTELLRTAAMRVAALQQAVGRAQTRIARELAMLGQPAGTPSDGPSAELASGLSGSGIYDATGARAGTVRVAGAYA